MKRLLMNVFMILILLSVCSSLSGCFWIFGSSSGNETGEGGDDLSVTKEYEYKFNIAGNEFVFAADVTSKNDVKSADVAFKRNGKVIKEGTSYSVENDEINFYGVTFKLSEGGKLLPFAVTTYKQSNIIYGYEMLAGSYTPSHQIYGYSGSTTLVLNSDGSASVFDGEFSYYPMYNDTVAVFNAENKGIVAILDYAEKTYELITKTSSPIFDGGEYIESYYDFLFDCERSYEGAGSFDGYTLKIFDNRYYMTDFDRHYTLGRASLDGDVLTVYTSDSDSYQLRLDTDQSSFDYQIERQFKNGNSYINIYSNGEIYVQTVYVGGECRIVCELGEGRIPALYHIQTDTTYVFDSELNDIASFDGEYYVDFSEANVYTSVVADIMGNKPQIMIENGSTAYQVKYNSHGCAEYTRDESAQILAANVALINSTYYFLMDEEYFSVPLYEMGTLPSAISFSKVAAASSAKLNTESDNLYKEDTVLMMENAYYAVVAFEDGTALVIAAQVVASEYFGQTLEFEKYKGSLVFMAESLTVINEADRTTFVELSEEGLYIRRTYPKLQSPDLVAQNDKYYALKSGSTYYVFDKEFVQKYEIAEKDYTGLDGLE